MSSPFITVAVPTLNSARTLNCTLMSLLSQRGCGVRVIVADSYSTDKTVQIATQWGAEIVTIEPGNMYRAINHALEKADSKWVAYLNSDDYVYEDTYFRLIELGDRATADVVYGQCDYVDGHGRHLFSFKPASTAALGSILRFNLMPFAQQAMIFRREMWLRLGGFSTERLYTSDVEFVRDAYVAGARFVRLAAPSVAAFRLHSEQISARMADDMAQEKGQRAKGTAGFAAARDVATMLAWRLRNVPSYIERALCRYQQTGKLGITRTLSRETMCSG